MYKLDVDSKDFVENDVEKANLNPFGLDLNKFQLYKIRSLMYLINFPITFMLRIMNVWQNIIDQNLLTVATDGYTNEDLKKVSILK